MRILHTSDWHLGRLLHGRKRYEEFTQYLNWLIETISNESVEILLIAGDIFDTTVPSNKAQELYYRFLWQVSETCCRHVVIIGGNHDSPSFLNAPRELLKFFQIHVIAEIAENPDNEVIVLYNKEKKPEAVVCAVPYLRDRDIRTVDPGESLNDKGKKLLRGISDHYNSVCSRAAEILDTLGKPVPLIVMGHLFTSGGRIVAGDGVRDLYIGGLAHIHSAIFPETADYVALGHLHIPQKAGTKDTIRYSGSPIPMSFGEANQQKVSIIVDISGNNVSVREISIPRFQDLKRISGTLEEITDQLENLKQENSKAWLEIEYTGTDIIADLRGNIEETVKNSDLDVLLIRNQRVIEDILTNQDVTETLDELGVREVFQRCLDAYNVVDVDRQEMEKAYLEIVGSLLENDINIE